MPYPRYVYRAIRQIIYDDIYTYCRKKNGYLSPHGWSKTESEFGFAGYNCDESFTKPLENVMYSASMLILGARLAREAYRNYYSERISSVLSKNSLQELIEAIPKEETENILHDLKILKFVPWDHSVQYEQKIEQGEVITSPSDDYSRYYAVMQFALERYYNSCRRKIIAGEGWIEDGSELMYVGDVYNDSVYENPIERLMYNVLMLTLDAGRASEECRKRYRKRIFDLLTENNLEEAVIAADLEATESFFVLDMKRLKSA